MADDDLPTRLQWPADPLDPSLAAPGSSGPTDAEQGDARGSKPRWVLGERDDVALLSREVSDLRHAVDDLADRVQLRQVKAALDELRSEVIALRRTVVEWPELDQLTSEVGALRSQLVDLHEDPPPTPDAAVLDALGEVRASIEALGSARTPVAALGPIVEELGEMREELGALRDDVVSLRRRVALRGQSGVTIDDDQLDRIVESVVARVQASAPAQMSRRRR